MKEPQDGCDTGWGENRLFPAESAKQNTQQLTIILQLKNFPQINSGKVTYLDPEQNPAKHWFASGLKFCPLLYSARKEIITTVEVCAEGKILEIIGAWPRRLRHRHWFLCKIYFPVSSLYVNFSLLCKRQRVQSCKHQVQASLKLIWVSHLRFKIRWTHWWTAMQWFRFESRILMRSLWRSVIRSNNFINTYFQPERTRSTPVDTSDDTFRGYFWQTQLGNV